MPSNKTICKKYGHDYGHTYENLDGICCTCTKCGHFDFAYKEDIKKQLHMFKRATIQPYNTKAWVEIHQDAPLKQQLAYGRIPTE